MKGLRIYFGLIPGMVLCVFLLGCTVPDKISVSTAVYAGSIDTPVLSKTVLHTATPAITPSPTSTSIPAASTPTPTSTMISTSLTTMTTEESLPFIQELFRTNADCKLPCWWGVTPGVATWPEVETFLHYVGESLLPPILEEDNRTYQGPASFDVHSSEGVIVNRVGFLERDSVIELINIYSEGYSNPVAFQDQWGLFSPQKVIKEYGVPSRVWLDSESSGPVNEYRKAGYTLWIFYDQLGFLIIYSGYGEYKPIYHFCPRFDDGEDIRFLQMYLQSPDNPNSIEETAEIIGLEIDPYPNVQSIEEAAGISTTDFYNLFVNEGEQACFDSPRDIWP